MEEVYQKTITTIFVMPILDISRKDLYENNFINAYLKDLDNDLYQAEDVIYLLFKPENEVEFAEFLAKEYARTKEFIDDYNHDEFIVLVYTINKEFEADIKIIKQSKYSLTSKKFKALFPKKIRNYNKSGTVEMLPSLQHMIFNRDKNLLVFWEKHLGTTLISKCNLEVWRAFEEELEVLDIDKVINELTKKQKDE